MRALPSSFGKSFVFSICFTLAAVLGTTFLRSSAAAQEQPQLAVATPRPLITEALDESRLTVLKGNTHPLARREFDLGTAPAILPMERMLLVLKRGDEQETALRKLLDDQQDKNSPSYHKWLTPEKFGAQFGPSDGDMQMITSWLQSHGFQVGSTKGRTVLEFSGSASQVQEAFHTSIHKYVVNGEQHWANANDPSIPVALAPAVKGVLTLHNFIKKPALHFSAEPVGAKLVQVPGRVRPQVTFPPRSGQAAINALAPQDYAVIYNIGPAYSAGHIGSGIHIGVIGRSNLFNGGQDVENFYSAIGTGNGSFPSFTIVVNGADPGDLGGGEEAEATLDSTWSGALAPGGNVSLIVSATTDTTDGVDLSEAYIVENNQYDIMTESFSACELFATDTQLAGASALAEQAAAQGITYFVSSGDDGAEACDDPNAPPATHPIAVNYLASTPFNVAVGGTTFNENGNTSKYWLSTPPISETAISYIPENAWNESSATNGLWATSGGASAGNIQSGIGTTPGVPKPSWQFGVTGIPNDNVRHLPDVSLTAAGHDPYLLCFEGSCQPDAQGNLFVYFISGTSASAPSFAGVMALIDQGAGSRQGSANYILYKLAASQGSYPAQCNGSNTTAPPASACIFNDVTAGNNVVPGEIGTNYQAGAGYDQTTGLGSVNVFNLQAAWNSVNFNPTTTALTLNSGVAVNITHGQTVPVQVTVSPSSGVGSAPTGDIVLSAAVNGVQSPIDVFRLTTGQIISATGDLPGAGIGSSYSVSAHYGGDSTYAPSDSTSVTVTVTPEPSTTSVSTVTFDQSGLELPFTTGPFGSFVYIRADVFGQSGHGFPSGTVTFNDTFGAIPGGNSFTLNSRGNTANPNGIFTFDSGTHTISGNYSGDASFSPSSTTQSQTFTITPGFFASISSTQSTVVISTQGGLGSTSVSVLNSTGFSGTINLACSGLPSESKCTFSPASVAANGTATTTTVSITVSTTAPTLSAQSQPPTRTHRWIVAMGMLFPAILLIAGKRRNPGLLLMMLLTILIMIPACGGGGSHKPPPDPGTPKGTSNVTVTATSGSIVSQSGFRLVVR